ncbi:type I-E CRISPR-associated protein Cse1/CasA [Streptomyces albidoflavus]|uniref:type I-E CRISPR-associated protein Cse1/CasA n=1 Tax=Streptomyces albidoflavus TaxID=1886 RepID=UPI00101E758D|nr:type I-E CRISPR-associated protein Cse1/CasA [Streptomyces albidoflavus]RZD62938.1 type I-E CRISPR-associated protein Cse1/CasA [Streptomyces albidoflavus]
MSTSYPLTTSGWIEVYDLDADELRSVGITEALTRAHRLVLGSPGSDGIVLLRLLAAVYDAACGPADIIEWDAAWRAQTLDTDRITSYLETWEDRFDLLHPTRPAFQCGALQEYNRGAQALDPATLGGDSGAWFNEKLRNIPAYGYPAWDPAEAAVRLLWLLAYDVAGIKGAVPGDPAAKKGKLYGSHIGPVAFLTHLHLNGTTLKDTLLLSLPPQPRTPGDAPVWEQPSPPAVTRIRPALGRLDRLTWPSRRIRLHAASDGKIDGIAFYDGDRRPVTSNAELEGLDPMSLWRTTTKGASTPLSIIAYDWVKPWVPGIALEPGWMGRSALIEHLIRAAERGVLGDMPISATVGEIIYSNRHQSTISADLVETRRLGTGWTLGDPEIRSAQARRARFAEAFQRALIRELKEAFGRPGSRYEPKLALLGLERHWAETVELEATDTAQAAHRWRDYVYEAGDRGIDFLPLRPHQREIFKDAARRPSRSAQSETPQPAPPAPTGTPAKSGRPATRYDWKGSQLSLAELAQLPECTVNVQTIRNRLKAGQSLDQAVTAPARSEPAGTGAPKRSRGRPAATYLWDGAERSLAEIAKLPECQVTLQTLRNRLKAGQSLEEAITTPSTRNPKTT